MSEIRSTEIWGAWYAGDTKQLIVTLHGFRLGEDCDMAKTVMDEVRAYVPILEAREVPLAPARRPPAIDREPHPAAITGVDVVARRLVGIWEEAAKCDECVSGIWCSEHDTDFWHTFANLRRIVHGERGSYG